MKYQHGCWIGREESCEERGTLVEIGVSLSLKGARRLFQCYLCHDMLTVDELRNPPAEVMNEGTGRHDIPTRHHHPRVA